MRLGYYDAGKDMNQLHREQWRGEGRRAQSCVHAPGRGYSRRSIGTRRVFRQRRKAADLSRLRRSGYFSVQQRFGSTKTLRNKTEATKNSNRMHVSSWCPACSIVSAARARTRSIRSAPSKIGRERASRRTPSRRRILTNNAVDRTMPLCKFPEQAHYKGSGDAKSAASWSCPLTDKSLLAVGANGVQAGVNADVPARVSAPAKLIYQ